MKKGQIAQIAVVVIAAAITLMFILTVFQQKIFTQKIYTEEINVMEARNGLFLTEKGMDASWNFASVQTLLKTGDIGAGQLYWYLLDNTKAINNKNGDTIGSAFIVDEKGVPKANPDLKSKNPVIFKPTDSGFELVMKSILISTYLPKVTLEYYLKGTLAKVSNIIPKSISLKDESIATVVNQKIETQGEHVTFNTEHVTNTEVSTKMKQILPKGKSFAEISNKLVKKTATFSETCEYCLKPSDDNGKTAVQVKKLADDFLKAEKDSFVSSNKNSDYDTESKIEDTALLVPGNTDKILGDQGGLELWFGTSLVFIDKKNIHPYDVRNAQFNVYEIAEKHGTLISSEGTKEDIFKNRPVALQFRTQGFPILLNCKNNNDKKFGFAQSEDLLCMVNKIWSCNTPIQGLAPANKKAHRNDVSYGAGVYRCLVVDTTNKWCKQGTDTRSKLYCCENWIASSSEDDFHPDNTAYCVKDGSCDNGVDNIDGHGGDLDEKCLYSGDKKNPDCPCVNSCCDPEEGEANTDAKGCVPNDYVNSGTECEICHGGPDYMLDHNFCKANHNEGSSCEISCYTDPFTYEEHCIYGNKNYYCNSNGNCKFDCI